jgi:hypothetical protein
VGYFLTFRESQDGYVDNDDDDDVIIIIIIMLK